MKLFLLESQCPGDIAVMTATVRDLKRSHPEYQINVRTSAQELWDNNPHLDRTVTQDNADMVIRCEYPLVHNSTRGQYHFIHGFRLFLEEKLGIMIPAGNFRVDIHLNEQEKNDPYITNIVGDKPFWIVDAGYKNGFTCKMWEFERFQEVIDMTKDRITWVQIGEANHNHTPLKNAINLIGRTTHRQFVSLMYRASGVLTPVSYPMHLSTMVWKDHSDDEHRPCIVIAGSREPSQWEAYPTHRYLHNCGVLPCSKKGSCWKSRVVKLGDGSLKDNSLCLCPVMSKSGQVIPRCLDMITPQMVVDNINLYLDQQ